MNASKFNKADITMKESVLISNEVVSSIETPGTYEEAMENKHTKEWKQACNAEMNSMQTYNVYKLVYTYVKRKSLVSNGYSR